MQQLVCLPFSVPSLIFFRCASSSDFLSLILPLSHKNISLPPSFISELTLYHELTKTKVVAGSRALAVLSPELRAIAYHSRIEYAPRCFQWMKPAHSSRLGHLIETEGLEIPLDKLDPWSKDKVCIYPMVWRNPITGEDCEWSSILLFTLSNRCDYGNLEAVAVGGILEV